MPEFIEPAVRDLRGSSSDESVALLVSCIDGGRDEVAAEIDGLGADTVTEIGDVSLRVEAPERIVDSICNLDTVVSVELDSDDVVVEETRNLESRPGSVM
ncbi:hypothetical protein GWK26_12750 [haloarchaeon 3A1-DGR]|nr:hypothetical protein GWK26_12750 [haloarchaeon 3A1-DGR]